MAIEHLVKLPPLKSGDRLSRAEFERRYAASQQINWSVLEAGEYRSPLM